MFSTPLCSSLPPRARAGIKGHFVPIGHFPPMLERARERERNFSLETAAAVLGDVCCSERGTKYRMRRERKQVDCSERLREIIGPYGASERERGSNYFSGASPSFRSALMYIAAAEVRRGTAGSDFSWPARDFVNWIRVISLLQRSNSSARDRAVENRAGSCAACPSSYTCIVSMIRSCSH